jgi:hypothetical protein
LNTNLRRAFVGVGSNIDVIVFANPNGEYRLNLADVPPNARGGVVYFGPQGVRTESLTEAIRGGQRSFVFQFGASTAGSAAFASLLAAPLFVTRGVTSQSEFIFSNSNTQSPLALFANELSLLLTTSNGVDSSAVESFGNSDGGSTASRQVPDSIERALADLEELWNELDGKPKGSKATTSRHSGSLRAWSALIDILNDFFGGKQSSTSPANDEDQPATSKEAASAGAERENATQSDDKSAASNQQPAQDQNLAAPDADAVGSPSTSANTTDTDKGGKHASSSEHGSESHAPAA